MPDNKMEEEEITEPQKTFQWPVHEVPDVFFTEAVYKEYSDNPPYTEILNMYKGLHSDDSATPQPPAQNPSEGPTKCSSGLETSKPGCRFPHYSQLTEGLVKFYLYLNHTYGVQRKRVVNDQQAKEYQQWVNFQKQIAMEQKEYQTFAQHVAMASPEDYAVFLPGSVQYLEKFLEDNKARVLKYPQLYRMNESVSLNADPVLPSDPQLTLFEDPRYQDDIQLLYCTKLENGSEELLCRGDQIVPNTEMQETGRIQQGDQPAKTDIVVSIKALETLIDNHQLENHPHQWEIPFTVTTSTLSSGSNEVVKTVVLEDPFARHNYYPYEANHLLASKLLKEHVQSSGKTFMETPTEARRGMRNFMKHFCVKKSDIYAAGVKGNHIASDKEEIRTPVSGISACESNQEVKDLKSGDLELVFDGEKKTEYVETETPDKKSLKTDASNSAGDEKSLKSGLAERNVQKRDCNVRETSRDNIQDEDCMQTSQTKGVDESKREDDSDKSENVSGVFEEDASLLDDGSKSNLEEAEEHGNSPEGIQVSSSRRLTRGMAKQMEHLSEGVSRSELETPESPPRVQCEVSSPESVSRRATRSASKRPQSDEGGPASKKRMTRSTAALTEIEEQVTENVKGRSQRKLNMEEENDGKMLGSKESPLELDGKIQNEKEMSGKGFEKVEGEANDTPKAKKLEKDGEEHTASILDKSESSDGELRIDLSEDNMDEKTQNETDSRGVKSVPQMRMKKTKMPLTKEEIKGQSVRQKDTANPSTVPLLDNILQLQRTFLAKKKSNQEVKTEVKRETESASSSSLMDNILQDQTTLLTKMSNVSSPAVSKDDLKKKRDTSGKRDITEKRANAGIWKIGKLKMQVTGGVDGLYWDYSAKKIFPATVWAKMEHQPWFGFEQVSMGETSRLWLKAAVFPQSKVIRGRIHCHSSDIMKWEVLGLNNLVGGTQFQPAYTTKVLHNIFTKLLTLDAGSYLLVHHAGDKQAFIYSTVEAEKAQRFIIYDLHAKHLGATIHHTPPPVVPWAPLDPSLLLPGSSSSLPCIFPPSPYVDQKEYYKSRRFVPMAGVEVKKKKKKKKNKGKKNKAKKEGQV